MKVGRRGFLIGAAALFAAPAIVRVGSLMPVQMLEPYELSGGVLTMQMITDEAARVLEREGAALGVAPVSNYLAIDAANQTGVDMCITTADMTLPMPKFSAQFIRPAMSLVARRISDAGGSFATMPLALPQYIDAGAISRRRIPVRGLRAYDICSDQFITRFDIRHTSQGA